MKKTAFCFAMMIGVTACSTREEDPHVDGGPCSYSYDTIGAVLIQADTLSGEQMNLYFLVCNGPAGDSMACDTMDFYQQNGEYALASEVTKSNIHMGDTLAFVDGHITEGTCNPENNVLLLKKYRRKF